MGYGQLAIGNHILPLPFTSSLSPLAYCLLSSYTIFPDEFPQLLSIFEDHAIDTELLCYFDIL